MAPAIYYISKIKIHDLRAAGFFIPTQRDAKGEAALGNSAKSSESAGDDQAVANSIRAAVTTETRKRSLAGRVTRFITIMITFTTAGALTMGAIWVSLWQIVPAENIAKPIGSILGVFAILVGAEIGLRLWTYHASQTGGLRQDVAARLLRNRRLPKLLANHEWRSWQIVLMFGYSCLLAGWFPWLAVPATWLWAFAGIIGIPLVTTVYALLRKSLLAQKDLGS